MNRALTDECELTTAEEQRKGVLFTHDIYHSDGPGMLSHISSFCVQSQRHRETLHMQPCTDSFYILEAFGILSF